MNSIPAFQYSRPVLPPRGTRRPRRFLLTDGMDGRSTFFFGPYLENYYIICLNCFRSLKYIFLHIFCNICGEKSECSFFQNISPKSTTTFFSKIFTRISQISRKLLNFFFSMFLVPLEE